MAGSLALAFLAITATVNSVQSYGVGGFGLGESSSSSASSSSSSSSGLGLDSDHDLFGGISGGFGGDGSSGFGSGGYNKASSVAKGSSSGYEGGTDIGFNIGNGSYNSALSVAKSSTSEYGGVSGHQGVKGKGGIGDHDGTVLKDKHEMGRVDGIGSIDNIRGSYGKPNNNVANVEIHGGFDKNLGKGIVDLVNKGIGLVTGHHAGSFGSVSGYNAKGSIGEHMGESFGGKGAFTAQASPDAVIANGDYVKSGYGTTPNDGCGKSDGSCGKKNVVKGEYTGQGGNYGTGFEAKHGPGFSSDSFGSASSMSKGSSSGYESIDTVLGNGGVAGQASTGLNTYKNAEGGRRHDGSGLIVGKLGSRGIGQVEGHIDYAEKKDFGDLINKGIDLISGHISHAGNIAGSTLSEDGLKGQGNVMGHLSGSFGLDSVIQGGIQAVGAQGCGKSDGCSAENNAGFEGIDQGSSAGYISGGHSSSQGSYSGVHKGASGQDGYTSSGTIGRNAEKEFSEHHHETATGHEKYDQGDCGTNKDGCGKQYSTLNIQGSYDSDEKGKLNEGHNIHGIGGSYQRKNDALYGANSQVTSNSQQEFNSHSYGSSLTEPDSNGGISHGEGKGKGYGSGASQTIYESKTNEGNLYGVTSNSGGSYGIGSYGKGKGSEQESGTSLSGTVGYGSKPGGGILGEAPFGSGSYGSGSISGGSYGGGYYGKGNGYGSGPSQINYGSQTEGGIAAGGNLNGDRSNSGGSYGSGSYGKGKGNGHESGTSFSGTGGYGRKPGSGLLGGASFGGGSYGEGTYGLGKGSGYGNGPLQTTFGSKTGSGLSGEGNLYGGSSNGGGSYGSGSYGKEHERRTSISGTGGYGSKPGGGMLGGSSFGSGSYGGGSVGGGSYGIGFDGGMLSHGGNLSGKGGWNTGRIGIGGLIEEGLGFISGHLSRDFVGSGKRGHNADSGFSTGGYTNKFNKNQDSHADGKEIGGLSEHFDRGSGVSSSSVSSGASSIESGGYGSKSSTSSTGGGGFGNGAYARKSGSLIIPGLQSVSGSASTSAASTSNAGGSILGSSKGGYGFGGGY